MTRINVIPVQELADQHLFIEFREITRVPKMAYKSLCTHGLQGTLNRIPPDYRLATGHVMFFYNKGLYLQKRFIELTCELTRRSYNFNRSVILDELHVFDEPLLCLDYIPTAEAIAANRARLAEKIAQRPDWYRFS